MIAKYRLWAEMARRLLQFHKGEDWRYIRLWGLFDWGDVSKYLNDGVLITHMKKENKTIWVWPTEDSYHKYIEPLIQKYTLEQLTSMAGW